MFTRSSLYKRISVSVLLLVLFLGALAFAQPASAQWDRSTDVSSETLRSYIEVLLARIAAMRTQLDTMRGETTDSTVSPDTSGQTSLVTTSSLAAAAAPGDSCVDSPIWSDVTGFNSDQLTDFSRAGYMAREKRTPSDVGNNVYNVRDLGALGDGEKNDTRAFERAIARATRNTGVVFVPEGTYKLTRPLRINSDNVVLRGEGTDTTILKFTKSLWEYCGYDYVQNGPGDFEHFMDNTLDDPTCNAEINKLSENDSTTPFSNERAFIQIGDESSGKMGNPENGRGGIRVTSSAERGDVELTLDSADEFEAGQWITLFMRDTDGTTLVEAVQGGNQNNQIGNSNIQDTRLRFVNKITEINEDTITLALPLTVAVKDEWNPRISDFETAVSNVGIEDLRIVFPYEEVGSHHHEEGHNAIEISSASNCWVTNVKINNTDLGIRVRRSAFCTIEDIEFNNTLAYETSSSRKREIQDNMGDLKRDIPPPLQDRVVRGEFDGHYGIMLAANTTHTLVQNVTFKNRFVHDISAVSFANRNVISKVSGIDLRLDHHRRSPNNNLYTEIDAGYEGDPNNIVWKSTGGDGRVSGPSAGGYNTYWNFVRDNGPVTLPIRRNWTLDSNPPQHFGLKLNFVFNTNNSSLENAHDSWEVTDKTGAWCQPNLLKAMRDYTKDARQAEPDSVF